MNYFNAQDRTCTWEMRNGQHLCHQCHEGGSGSLLEYQVGLHTDLGCFHFLFCTFKGEPKQKHKLAWKHQKCANISMCRLHLVVLSIFIPKKRKKVFASNLRSTWHSCISLFFYWWRAEKGQFVMFDTFVSDPGLVYNITDGHTAVAVTAFEGQFVSVRLDYKVTVL